MKKINQRKDKFYEELIPYLGKYSKEMLRAFFDYWSEYNRSQTKMRCEMQPTWELSKRLSTWSRNQKVYGKSNSTNERKESVRTGAELAGEVLRRIASEEY